MNCLAQTPAGPRPSKTIQDDAPTATPGAPSPALAASSPSLSPNSLATTPPGSGPFHLHPPGAPLSQMRRHGRLKMLPPSRCHPEYCVCGELSGLHTTHAPQSRPAGAASRHQRGGSPDTFATPRVRAGREDLGATSLPGCPAHKTPRRAWSRRSSPHVCSPQDRLTARAWPRQGRHTSPASSRPPA